MPSPTNFSILWAATVVSACALWGYLGIRVLIAVCNLRDTAKWLDKAIHRACAAHEAMVAGLDAWDAYKARNKQAWKAERPALAAAVEE
jgi:hypothetical protein